MRQAAHILPRDGILCVMTKEPNLLRRGLLALFCAAAVALGACNDGVKQGSKDSFGSKGRAQGEPQDLLDPNDDVIGDGPFAGAEAKSATGMGAGASRGGGGAPSAQAAGQKDGRWSVMLATFTQPDHAERAAAFRGQLVREYPELAQAAIVRVGRGSAIAIGRFGAPADKDAQAELKRVKAIERNGARPFAGAMLLRTTTDTAAGVVKPQDIRNLRARYPKVRPLFTLQVAAWSTFGEKGMDFGEMRRAAERYCAELRAKGHEAWFHHDEDRETSIVTVGNFDRRAYDARSTLFAPEVEDLMRRFPTHLTNGEPVLILADPRNPKSPSRPQACRLVEVPEF
jgi:hypothetical protein